MTVQQLPRAAVRYQTAQTREIAAALAAIRRQWRRMSVRDIDAAWRHVGPMVLSVALTAQDAVSAQVPAYMSAVLRETGQAAADDPAAAARPAALVGATGDGRTVRGFVDQVPIQAKVRIRDGLPPGVALRQAGLALQAGMATILSDTARQAEVVETAVRPVTGYVRMLQIPSCSRCVVLAGRRYKTNQGFERHPRCDCRHIPASEAVAGDLAADPRAYFDSLSAAEQERTFTGAGAEAIRNGADMSRVVNARRGMRRAQVFGRRVVTTSESVVRGGVRLMPESIVAVANGDRSELVRLLRLHGYIV